jgi:hypothetical protein
MFQSRVTRPCSFGACGKSEHYGGTCVVEEAVQIMVDRKQKERKGMTGFPTPTSRTSLQQSSSRPHFQGFHHLSAAPQARDPAFNIYTSLCGDIPHTNNSILAGPQRLMSISQCKMHSVHLQESQSLNSSSIAQKSKSKVS